MLEHPKALSTQYYYYILALAGGRILKGGENLKDNAKNFLSSNGQSAGNQIASFLNIKLGKSRILRDYT